LSAAPKLSRDNSRLQLPKEELPGRTIQAGSILLGMDLRESIRTLIVMVVCGLVLGIAVGALLGAVAPDIVRWVLQPMPVGNPVGTGIGFGIMNGSTFGFFGGIAVLFIKAWADRKKM
jgi:hypothetical protein